MKKNETNLFKTNINTTYYMSEYNNTQEQITPIELDYNPLFKEINNLIMSFANIIATKYHLDKNELINMIPKNPYFAKTKKIKNDKEDKKYPIPWCPDHIDYDKCNSLSFNKGLYTQCGRKKTKENNGSKEFFCNICRSNPDETYQKYGLISDRKKVGVYDYIAPGEGIPEDKKKPVQYLDLIPSDVSISQLKQYFKDNGYINIPEEHFHPRTKIPSKSRNKKPTLHIEEINLSPTNCESFSPLNSPRESFDESLSHEKEQISYYDPAQVVVDDNPIVIPTIQPVEPISVDIKSTKKPRSSGGKNRSK